ncbi:MAG TPA: Dabb family protein [Candidatus Hydrogenedens sp.]|nr:Dabb family protein [Candidatus Hydrogenedens sp.]HOL20912.1 Dabb family protein [Candidatus Hydrogenedens sp.]
MVVHSVYFWLKEDICEAKKQAFYEGLLELSKIPSVVKLYVGTPAQTAKRPVIDDSYTFGLVVIFSNIKGHDAYQNHEIHRNFLSEFSSFWNKVLIYDFEC